MGRIFLRRLVMSLLLIIIVPSLTFFFLAFTPGNIAEEILGPNATPQQLHSLEAQFGLNRPLYRSTGIGSTGCCTARSVPPIRPVKGSRRC